jgi:hypothetical protein
MRRLLLAVFAIAIVTTTAGCQQAKTALNVVEAALAEAPMLIEAARAAAMIFFAVHPDPMLQAQLERRIADASLAADSAANALAGANDISAGDSAKAFAEWNKSYDELLAALRDAHILMPSGPTQMVGAGPQGGTIRLPLHPISGRFVGS